jgi:hypothetical protein
LKDDKFSKIKSYFEDAYAQRKNYFLWVNFTAKLDENKSQVTLDHFSRIDPNAEGSSFIQSGSSSKYVGSTSNSNQSSSTVHDGTNSYLSILHGSSGHGFDFDNLY